MGNLLGKRGEQWEQRKRTGEGKEKGKQEVGLKGERGRKRGKGEGETHKYKKKEVKEPQKEHANQLRRRWN